MSNLNNKQKGLLNKAAEIQKIIFDNMGNPVIVIRRNYSSVFISIPNEN